MYRNTSKQPPHLSRYSRSTTSARERLGMDTDPGASIAPHGGQFEVCLADNDHNLSRVSVRAYKRDAAGRPTELIKVNGFPSACCQAEACIRRTREKLRRLGHGTVFIGHPTATELLIKENAAAASAPTPQPAPTPGSRTLSSRPTAS